MKEQLLAYLQNQTAFFFSAENVKRCLYSEKILPRSFQSRENTISHYLNQLTEEGRLVKIATRPVYFFISRHLRAKTTPLTQNVYESLAAVAAEKPFLIKRRFLFQCDRQQRQSGRSHWTDPRWPPSIQMVGFPSYWRGKWDGEEFSGKKCSITIVWPMNYWRLMRLWSPSIAHSTPTTKSYWLVIYLDMSKGLYRRRGRSCWCFWSSRWRCLVSRWSSSVECWRTGKIIHFSGSRCHLSNGDTRRPVTVDCRLVFATTEDLKQTF